MLLHTITIKSESGSENPTEATVEITNDHRWTIKVSVAGAMSGSSPATELRELADELERRWERDGCDEDQADALRMDREAAREAAERCGLRVANATEEPIPW